MSQIHIIPTLEDNYTYVIQSGDKAVIIDCGDAAPVIYFLKTHKLQPTDLLLTHHHWDHIDGSADLKSAFPAMNIYGPEKDRPRIPFLENGLSNGDNLNLGDLKIDCIETPGHTQNHLCYHLPQQGVLFSGDALFSMGCGRLFEGTAGDLFNSMQKIKTLPKNTLIYCGHEYTLTNVRFSLSVDGGNLELNERKSKVEELRQRNRPTLPVSLEEELTTNPFLKAETIEKIAQLRQLRDKF